MSRSSTHRARPIDAGSGLAPLPRTGTYRHLAWAGVELRWGGQRILVDPLEDTTRLAGFLGAPRGAVRLADPLPDVRTDVLLTHLHADHFDPSAIVRHLGGGGRVWCPAAAADVVAAGGCRSRVSRSARPIDPLGLGSEDGRRRRRPRPSLRERIAGERPTRRPRHLVGGARAGAATRPSARRGC